MIIAIFCDRVVLHRIYLKTLHCGVVLQNAIVGFSTDLHVLPLHCNALARICKKDPYQSEDHHFFEAFPKQLDAPLSIVMLRTHMSGRSCFGAGHFSGGYYPDRLGGLLYNNEVAGYFEQLLKKPLEDYNSTLRKLKLPPVEKFEFCFQNPLCTELMDQAYESYAQRGEAVDPFYSKWIKLVQENRHQFSTFPKGDPFIHRWQNPVEFETERRIRSWWSGSCDKMVVLEGLFGDWSEYSSESERLALNLVKYLDLPIGMLGHNHAVIRKQGRVDPVQTREAQEDPHPVNLLKAFLLADLNQDQVCVAMDVDPSVEIWNEQLRGYQINSIRELNPGEVSAWYASAKKISRFVNHEKSVSKLFEIEFQYAYGGDETPDQKTVDAILETDEKSMIVGGEWLSVEHPDFVWNFSKKELSAIPYNRSLVKSSDEAYLDFIKSILESKVATR